MFRLDAGSFQLELSARVFEADIRWPENTALDIKVVSDGFSAGTTMDVDRKALAGFSKDLLRLYTALSGKARLEEPYGMHSCIQFEAAARGHIKVRGVLHSGRRSGHEQELSFENEFDQTFLQDFVQGLFAEYGRYPG